MHDIVEAIRILVHTGPIGDMLALEVTTNIQSVGLPGNSRMYWSKFIPKPHITHLFKDLYQELIISSPTRVGYFGSRNPTPHLSP